MPTNAGPTGDPNSDQDAETASTVTCTTTEGASANSVQFTALTNTGVNVARPVSVAIDVASQPEYNDWRHDPQTCLGSVAKYLWSPPQNSRMWTACYYGNPPERLIGSPPKTVCGTIAVLALLALPFLVSLVVVFAIAIASLAAALCCALFDLLDDILRCNCDRAQNGRQGKGRGKY
jgi:hypothetical protein